MNTDLPMLYLGYGANTNHRDMARRCPTARYLGNAELLDHRLIFRSVADVIPVKGQKVICALWELQPADERSLDSFEGYPNFYGKAYAAMPYKKRERRALFYFMAGNRKDRHEPPRGYEQTLRRGYAECGMDPAQIDAAIRDAVKSERRVLRYNGKWLEQPRRPAPVVATSHPFDSGLLPAVRSRTLADEMRDLKDVYPDWDDDGIRDYLNMALRGEVDHGAA